MAIRRATAPPPAPPAAEGVAFGSLGFYSGGFDLPESDYAMEHSVQMYQPRKKDGSAVGSPFLAVVLTAYPLSGGEPVQHEISMGAKAALSFVPNETGKGLLPVPGGPSASLSDQTNWGIYLKSLYDSGLDVGIFTNDLTVLDGIHVHTQNIPEPESRKQLRSQTGEAAMQGAPEARTRNITVVTEIKDDGKPWEGTGGLPDGQAKAAPAKAKATPVAAPAAVRRPVAVPVAAATEDVTEQDIEDAALQGITSVLEQEKNANGCSKLMLRTGTFGHVEKAISNDMAQAVTDTYFGSDATLSTLLSKLGYSVSGAKIVVVG